MIWLNFLHFYQPFNQQMDILERVVNESYRPIIKGLKETKVKITLNINAGLTDLLIENGYEDVVEDLKKLAEKKQIEFTGSAKYHPFLPLLPEEEIERQIKLNVETNKKYFGKIYNPKGFFSPELAYSEKTAKIVKKLGYQWLLAEELANPQKNDFTKIYHIKNLAPLKILFRNKKISVLLLSAIVRSPRSLIEELGEELLKKSYLLTVMDAETIGHHRPGLEKEYFEILKDKRIKKSLISEIIKKFESKEEISPRECTWSSEEQDVFLEKNNSFILWNDPENPLHRLQWDFTYFAVKMVKKYKKGRELLDKALQSDQYWWASAKPWWSLEMIEQGAFALREIIFLASSLEEKNKAEEYYHKILDLAFDWQRRGKIRQAYREQYKTTGRKPLKKRTPAHWYNLLLLELEDEIKKAVKNQEFEKAIKWRDAVFKLDSGADIYDVLHVIDDLRNSRALPSLKSFYEHTLKEMSPFIKKYFKDFDEKKFKKEQPEKIKEEMFKTFEEQLQGLRQAGPLGLNLNKRGEVFLSEFPSFQIKFMQNQGWNSYSKVSFDKKGIYQAEKQCLYEYDGKIIIINIAKNSLLYEFRQYLIKKDLKKGKELKIAVLAESLAWTPVYFKKNLQAKIPYFPNMGFKFRFSNFYPRLRKKTSLIREARQKTAQGLGKISYLLQKIIFYLQE